MDAPSTEARAKSPRLSFSLLNLLLGSALLVTVISHVVASRELHQRKAEVRKMRAELGYLDIQDPTKCYVTYVPQLEQQHYLFRIYLPPGHNYARNSKHVSKSTYGRGESGGAGSISESGEMTLRCKLYRDESGVLKFTVSGLGSSSTMQFGPETALGASSNSITVSTPPSTETRELALGERIQLLTLKAEKADDPNTTDEITVWLDPAAGTMPVTPVKPQDRSPQGQP